jgi:ABC-type Na+ efflux pump permease subunit
MSAPKQRSLVFVVARTELRQLAQSPDFWVPMVVLAAIFFVVSPAVLLTTLTRLPSAGLPARVSGALDLLPASVQAPAAAHTAPAKTAYVLAVHLFAPLAVIVPMTICTAVGAATLVGERERGTGEWLAQTPATERDLYLGKLLAALVPGYGTALVGFGAYSLLVDLIVGPQVGGWFFPTPAWWVLVLGVVPAFLALTLAVVLRLSGRVRSAAAAQQASGLVTLPLIMVSYGASSGDVVGLGPTIGLVALVWLGALWGLARGQKAVRRSRLLGVD